MKFKVSLLVCAIVLNNIRSSTSEYSPATNLRFTPEAVIHQLSEQIRFLIRSGDINNGIPVLDPYEFQWKQLDLAPGQIFSANVNITKAKATGLGNFKLQHFDFSKNDVSIAVHIDIPVLKFNSEYYELNGNVYEAIPIKGQGIADIEIHNTSLWGKIYLKQSDDSKSILLDKIEEPEFSIERIVSRTQFDNNIDGLISSMVEELLADYLTRFNKYIATAYIDKIVGYLNPTLDKFDNWNIIAVLLSDNQDNGGNDNN
ncbi:uncharacterized protein LOC124637572 [Helicoverpa zea]|uniref:uncharacterized protein LOC124637572 n=1 Tax=Helicoverpa zea TaxID=7113 RepID=UPI001F5AC5BC|nr:uncharacterized protein LOC124637572 [Helicoverpa zea]